MNLQPVIPSKTPFYPIDALTGLKLYCVVGYPSIYADIDSVPTKYYSQRSTMQLLRGSNNEVAN